MEGTKRNAGSRPRLQATLDVEAAFAPPYRLLTAVAPRCSAGCPRYRAPTAAYAWPPGPSPASKRICRSNSGMSEGGAVGRPLSGTEARSG